MWKKLGPGALGALVVLSLAGGSVGATAVQPVEATARIAPAAAQQGNQTLVTPLAGMTDDQSARLTLVNVGTSSMQATAALVGADGGLGSKAFTLAPGQTGELTLSGAQRGLAYDSRGRLQLFGEIAVVSGDSLAGSLEVFDSATGTTRILVPAILPTPGPLPSPLLVSGSIGLRSGQMARVSVVNLGSTTESVSLGVLQTNPLVTRVVSLAPGGIASVDLNPAARGLTFDRTRRVQVRGRVSCRDTDCMVFATIEAYVITTGRSEEDAPMLTPIQLP